MSFLINIRKTITSFVVMLFMMLGVTAGAHAANVTLNISVMGSGIYNYAIQVWAEPCSGSTIYCFSTGNSTDYSDEYLCSGITADTNIYMSIANSSGNVTEVQYGYCDDSLGDLVLEYSYIPTGSVSGPTGQCYCSGGSGSSSSSSSSSEDCTYFKMAWENIAGNSQYVSEACSNSGYMPMYACSSDSGCMSWYSSNSSTLNSFICSNAASGLSATSAATAYGLDCSVRPGSGEVYILANCSNHTSSSSKYYNECNLTGENCGYTLAAACHGEFGSDTSSSYYGAVVPSSHGNTYLICFNSSDSGICGCSTEYPANNVEAFVLQDSASGDVPGTIHTVDNMAQLNCCRGYSASVHNDVDKDMGNGVMCDTQYQCETDGTKSVYEQYCRCSGGYYSTAEYTYAPGYNLMNGFCEPCDSTIPSDGANSVNVLPTSNGGGDITSCYLRTGTQGTDDKGEYTITGSDCKYSK